MSESVHYISFSYTEESHSRATHNTDNTNKASLQPSASPLSLLLPSPEWNPQCHASGPVSDPTGIEFFFDRCVFGADFDTQVAGPSRVTARQTLVSVRIWLALRGCSAADTRVCSHLAGPSWLQRGRHSCPFAFGWPFVVAARQTLVSVCFWLTPRGFSVFDWPLLGWLCWTKMKVLFWMTTTWWPAKKKKQPRMTRAM